MNEAISEEFYDSFRSGVGSYCVTCGCGITHFSHKGIWANSEEEYEETVKNSQEYPDKYNMMGEHEAASLIDLGIQYVYGCECGTVQKYEAWIWRHREEIMKYLSARGKKELQAAQSNMDALAKIANI